MKDRLYPLNNHRCSLLFENGIFDAPVFTRPPVFEGKEVPEVLMSGHHAEINAWREKIAQEKTERVRPDLMDKVE